MWTRRTFITMRVRSSYWIDAQRHAAQVTHVDYEDGRRRHQRECEGDFGDNEGLRQAPRRILGELALDPQSTLATEMLAKATRAQLLR